MSADPLARLLALRTVSPRRVVGLISGTSADGFKAPTAVGSSTFFSGLPTNPIDSRHQAAAETIASRPTRTYGWSAGRSAIASSGRATRSGA